MVLAAGIDVREEGLLEICRRYQVSELSLFGSLARGEAREDSDVDLMVEFEPGARIGLWRFGELEEELTRLFGRKVDLVSKRGLKPRIRPKVMRDARVLYAA